MVGIARHFSSWQNRSIHDAASLLLRDDDEIGQPCVFRGDGRASGLWFSARSTGKMKIPANASVHYVAATRKRDTRHCCNGVTQEIVLHTLDILVAYSRNGVFMNFLWGHSSRTKYVAEFRSRRQDLREIRHTYANVIAMNLFCPQSE